MKLKQIIAFYKDEPWWRVFSDIYWGLYLGSTVGFQLAKEDWKNRKKKK